MKERIAIISLGLLLAAGTATVAIIHPDPIRNLDDAAAKLKADRAAVVPEPKFIDHLSDAFVIYNKLTTAQQSREDVFEIHEALNGYANIIKAGKLLHEQEAHINADHGDDPMIMQRYKITESMRDVIATEDKNTVEHLRSAGIN